MALWQQLWRDECGAILTAEAVLLGSIGVLGGVVGLSAASSAVNDEMTEMATAIRSLDQSYVIRGRSSCGAWTAGSYYIQPRVEQSVAELCGESDFDVIAVRNEIDAQRDRIYPKSQDDEARPNHLPAKKSSEKTSDKKKSDRQTDMKRRDSQRNPDASKTTTPKAKTSKSKEDGDNRSKSSKSRSEHDVDRTTKHRED